MRGFVNPYNFIHFPENKAHAYTDEDRHTGVIHYTITSKTPLFIPNSSSETAFTESETPDHKSYDFFSYTELDPTKRYEKDYPIPVIPGSEMRGVVRNVYETLTDSCMSMLNTDTYPVKRSPERFEAALLHRDSEGKWELLPALSLRIGLGADACWKTTKKGKKIRRATKPPKGFEDCHNGATIYYQEPEQINKWSFKTIEHYSDKVGKYTKHGYLLKWGMGVAKLHYHVFVVQKSEPAISEFKLSKDIVERKMFPVLESYLNQPALTPGNKAAYEEYENDLKRFLNGNEEAYFPVTCSKIGNRGIFYLAPAIFSKEVSNENLEKFAGKFSPCKDNFCPACDLFGYIGTNNENAKGSKIRFSDLYPEKYDAMQEVLNKSEQRRADINQEIQKAFYLEENNGKVTLQALAEPKLGNVEFYLKRPNKRAEFWTYDYYTTRDACDAGRGQTHLYTNCQLRGRKYYWHHREVDTARATYSVVGGDVYTLVNGKVVYAGGTSGTYGSFASYPSDGLILSSYGHMGVDLEEYFTLSDGKLVSQARWISSFTDGETWYLNDQETTQEAYENWKEEHVSGEIFAIEYNDAHPITEENIQAYVK